MALAANGILDYVEGAWDLVRSTDPVFRGRNGLIIMADELFVQLRNVLLDVSRKLQSYLSDELLESTVSRLKQISRHLLLFAGTNANMNDLIASISSVLSLLATFENRLYSSGYNAPVNLSGHPGRPKFDISREQLDYFLFYDLGVQDIANVLSVSKSTVQRRFREYGISVSSAMSQVTNYQLDDLVKRLKTIFQMKVIVVLIHMQLRCQGIKVSQSRVREVMQRVDPEGVGQRWLVLTPWCNYSVPGPLSLWHIDGTTNS